MDDAGGRTSATAASYAASLFSSCAYWRGVRLRRFGPIRCAAPSASLWEAQRYPSLFVMVWSAPPTSSATADLVQHLRAAMCSAVDLPDGARRNRQSRRPTNVAGRAAGKGAPVSAALGVQVGARDDELLDDRVIVVARRIHQGGAPIPAHGGALRRG